MAHPEIILFLLATASGKPLGPTFVGYFSEGFPFQEVASRIAAWSPDRPENVWELSGQHEGDIMLLPDSEQVGSSRNIITNDETRWPDSTLPYYIDPVFSEKEQDIIQGALKEFNEKSCVKLVPYKDEKKPGKDKSLIRTLSATQDDVDEARLFAEKKKPANYIWIQGEPTGCWSMVGRQKSKGLLTDPENNDDSDDVDSVEQEHSNVKRSGKRKKRSWLETLGLGFFTGAADKGPGPGGQVVNLQRPGCVHHGVIVHEVLHALGFFHQQSAYNRDEYVEIVWNNIEKGKEGNFQKYNESQVTDFGVEYDYSSVMHYGRTAFSKDGNDTIVPLKDEAKIGQRKGMSEKDVEKLTHAYCEQKEGS